MDGFTVIVILLCVVGAAGFGVGRMVPLAEVKSDCTKSGEVVIQGTVIKCKPVAAWVDGKRIEFVE